ncbi:murein transglycosylase A [Yoonia litorea]|uniref:peptidoglycan lytic exotransglycosylase n=1 Tax=Yoonia litorea TaxID=1123755 RepID=A0A1I6MW75_9RHOB|nr:MltA domain-containing protein [Yoonia litorea]SFS19808.1 membrane-bound lytic murein transglycosylase A [Yoonia litorea]
MATLRYTRLAFADLQGWADDNHQAALSAYRLTVDALEPHWPRPSEVGARRFFETAFTPVQITDDTEMLFTGYFEPEYDAVLSPSETHKYPAYAPPEDLDPSAPYLTRQEIDAGRLQGRGLELAWFDDPLDLYFLQVQGSGRIKILGGEVIRLGFAAKNGRPYTSLGKVMIARGYLDPKEVSPETIRRWFAENPEEGQALLWENESYVFFQKRDGVRPDEGPLGAMGQPVTAGRTIAVDPEACPLGAPVWIEKSGDAPINRLTVAQDIGSAIKGAQRADIFCGTGEDAGRPAGQIKDRGRMVVLMPHQMANALCEEH